MTKFDADDQWREKLSPEEYAICRQRGTERAFSGAYWNEKAPGVYRCKCCDAPLFDAGAKYDSGTGWPSFFQPVDAGRVATETDRSHGMVRTEARCAQCGSHLGHVFEDGPRPTGLRYCINSASLALQRREADGEADGEADS